METSSTLRCRNVWNFAHGSKFKADFCAKMSVCIDMNWGWGFKPLPPGNSNPGRRLAHRPHTPISIAPCALALAPTLPPASDSWCRPCWQWRVIYTSFTECNSVVQRHHSTQVSRWHLGKTKSHTGDGSQWKNWPGSSSRVNRADLLRSVQLQLCSNWPNCVIWHGSVEQVGDRANIGYRRLNPLTPTVAIMIYGYSYEASRARPG